MFPSFNIPLSLFLSLSLSLSLPPSPPLPPKSARALSPALQGSFPARHQKWQRRPLTRGSRGNSGARACAGMPRCDCQLSMRRHCQLSMRRACAGMPRCDCQPLLQAPRVAVAMLRACRWPSIICTCERGRSGPGGDTRASLFAPDCIKTQPKPGPPLLPTSIHASKSAPMRQQHCRTHGLAQVSCLSHAASCASRLARSL